jgi:membrane-associated phospholipid phosphatase
MISAFRRILNIWFIIPFLLWVVIGGFLLSLYDKRELLHAVNSNHNAVADVVMYVLTQIGNGTSIAVMLLLIMVFFKRYRTWQYFLAAVICNVLPALIIQLLKDYFDEPRPFDFFKEESGSWIHFDPMWGEKLFYHSFPSGHSAGAFSFCCFVSMLLPNKYRWCGLLLFAFAMSVGYSRMYLAAHFFKDVYFGSILGTLLTVVLFVFTCTVAGGAISVWKNFKTQTFI